MPADAVTAAQSASTAAVASRWQAIDGLLPAPRAPRSGCGAEFVAAGADGRPAATGTCQHWTGTPESLELTWGAARRFELRVSVAGPDVGSAMDQLLAQWRDHLGGVPGAGTEDSAATVTWPSRDIDGVAALVRHGLAPMTVIAARVRGRRPGVPAAGPPPRADDTAGLPGQDLRIRRAGPADLDAVVGLGMEVIRFDATYTSAEAELA
jgi:hypothetical protein